MKRILLLVLLGCNTILFAQKKSIDNIINVSEVTRIEKVLSADDMMGRKIFTPGIEKAADFIAAEFRKMKVDPLAGLTTHRQTFSLIRSKTTNVSGLVGKDSLTMNDLILLSTGDTISVTEASNYTRLYFDSSVKVLQEVQRIARENKNYIVFIDRHHAKDFERLKRLKRQTFPMNHNAWFVLSNGNPASFNITAIQQNEELELSNVVGMIPGRSKPDEFVIFSGHYDHLGTGRPNAQGDSIYNGANDDASGITAMMLLARYFNTLKDNERTLIFAAFTAEEVGGYGSRYFSSQVNPDKVVAMFNIEMIGTESKWGKNNAFITGYEKSDMGRILQQNLEGSAFKFEPDPYPSQNLFYRSDNATLAALGVPAHTISTTQMDKDKFYHSQDDEIETLDLHNMTEIIKAIALSSRSIISGKDTPSRVEKL